MYVCIFLFLLLSSSESNLNVRYSMAQHLIFTLATTPEISMHYSVLCENLSGSGQLHLHGVSK